MLSLKPHLASLKNAIVLILFGLWGYLASDTPSLTALIPVFTGVVLVVLTPWFAKDNKVAAHIAVGLTLLILIGLIKPLTGAIARNDTAAIMRLIIMMFTSIYALTAFVVSFIRARFKK
ncbi:MAG: hypothetical protein JXA77_07590 [Bacteroidales bacterium]|nr:hypothetical protein [Bacteroidales bacterium]MBN2821498.1 hypothetical protein [Bacteroidales bacterium]